MPHYNSTKYVSHIIKPNIISSLLNDSANQIRLKCHHSRLNLNFFQQLKIFLEAILTFVIWENYVSSKVIFRRCGKCGLVKAWIWQTFFWQFCFGKCGLVKAWIWQTYFWPFCTYSVIWTSGQIELLSGHRRDEFSLKLRKIKFLVKVQ